MELIATYLALNTVVLDETIDIIDNRDDDEEVIDYVEELLNNDDLESLELDKYWDVFHYLFNHVSSSHSLLNMPLSQAILGCSKADTEEYISIIEPSQVDAIVESLSHLNLEELLLSLDKESLIEANVYPQRWDNDKVDIVDLNDTIKIMFDDLLLFYKDVKKNGQGILVTII